MKVETAKEAIDIIQYFLDECWESMKSEEKPTNELDWAKLHGRQESYLSVIKFILQVKRADGYFQEENK